MMTKDDAITVMYTPVQWQGGVSDCGILALAFATSLCTGQDPAAVSYDHPCMCAHLLASLIGGEITQFPQKSQSHRAKIQRADTELVPVFCICILPDDGATMVQCDGCGFIRRASCQLLLS